MGGMSDVHRCQFYSIADEVLGMGDRGPDQIPSANQVQLEGWHADLGPVGQQCTVSGAGSDV